jgi:hypothetical protein
MSEERVLRDRLRELPIADEAQAEERGWRVVSAAYGERYLAGSPRRAMRLALAAATVAALLALALTPAGAEVVDVVEDMIGVAEEDAKPALRSLPTAGELLVGSEVGPWIVREDGSKRLLGDYGGATWSSPRGLYVAATDGRLLVALDTVGEVRWTVAAPERVRDPQWSPSGYRIAYRSGDDLRVVSGDGTGDHLVARDVAAVAPVWRPRPESEFVKGPGVVGPEQISFVDAEGRPRLVDADTGEETTQGPRAGHVSTRYGVVREIAWSANGELFLAASNGDLVVDRVEPGPEGFFAYVASGKAVIEAAAVAPNGDRLAVLERRQGRSVIRLLELTDDRRSPSAPLFAGPGAIDDVTWSPDGHWLLAGWESADQWLFLRADRPRRLIAIDDISRQFEPGGAATAAFPQVEGWVLPQR